MKFYFEGPIEGPPRAADLEEMEVEKLRGLAEFLFMKNCWWVLAGSLGLGLGGCVGMKEKEPALETVTRVDLDRYAGVWHEVGRLPNWFQRPGDRDTTATYTKLAGGKIEVRNATLGADGRRREVRGVAKPVPNSGDAKLRVSFFGPFFGDYWIIGLEEKNYRWAVVGHPSRKYLWFLSRSPNPSSEELSAMRRVALGQGYSLENLITPTDASADLK
jgi:apolipoprotein D and lipocalin family protein